MSEFGLPESSDRLPSIYPLPKGLQQFPCDEQQRKRPQRVGGSKQNAISGCNENTQPQEDAAQVHRLPNMAYSAATWAFLRRLRCCLAM